MAKINADKSERVCRCEAAVPPHLMDGFACGNSECWRTEEAKASFAAFVADVVRKREADVAPPSSKPAGA